MPPPNTPAESYGANVARSPQDGGLPRFDAGSASATMCRGLLGVHCTLRPACALNPRGTLFWKCFNRSRYLLPSPPLLPAGATEAGWESHPLKTNALSRNTSKIKASAEFLNPTRPDHRGVKRSWPRGPQRHRLHLSRGTNSTNLCPPRFSKVLQRPCYGDRLSWQQGNAAERRRFPS